MDNKKFALIRWVVAFGLVAVPAFALNNGSTHVRKVEALASGRGYLHLEESMSSQPACAAYDNVIACDLSLDYCKEALRIALAAKLSGKTIEFSVAPGCVGDVARFDRLRIE